MLCILTYAYLIHPSALYVNLYILHVTIFLISWYKLCTQKMDSR